MGTVRLLSGALLRSRGVSPRLLRISALFIQNSSMMSARLVGVSAGESGSFRNPGTPFSETGLASGVEVTAGTGWVRTGELEDTGVDGSLQVNGWEQMGERGLLVGEQVKGRLLTGDSGSSVSGSRMGCKWIRERDGAELRGLLTSGVGEVFSGSNLSTSGVLGEGHMTGDITRGGVGGWRGDRRCLLVS